MDYKYHQFYCEENIWHLCQEDVFRDMETRAVVIASQNADFCPFHQHGPDIQAPVCFWDYHVILVARQRAWMVYDFDSRLPFPLGLSAYLRQTFPSFQERQKAGKKDAKKDREFSPITLGGAANTFQTLAPQKMGTPFFRVMKAHDYVELLASDRSHMLDEMGNYEAPPPPWPPIHPERGNNVLELASMDKQSPGSILSLKEFRTHLR